MAKEPPSIAIIGAGPGGLAMAVKLKQAGLDDFTVFERSAGPGGTWWDNTYPGAGVDIASSLYSFSFKRDYDWSRTHANQAELLRYIDAVVEEFGLRPHLRFGAGVAEAAWDDTAQAYDLRLDDGTVHRFRAVVSGLGMLNVPNYPTWPGLESFAGPKFHTARWEHRHDLSGKRVAVVGTGSTAAQVVPALAPKVGHLTLYQREAGWILPKMERDFTEEERARLRRSPLLRDWRRFLVQWNLELARRAIDPAAKHQARLRQRALDHLATVRDPATRAALTPDYPLYCKRVIVSDDFYAALNRENVALVPRPVASVTRTGLVDVDGVERPADVLVMATGFKAASYLHGLSVKGREGRSLHEAWGTEPQAFLGICVPGFPNFFILYGPNTNGGSIIFNLERQAEWIARALRRVARRGLGALEVRESAFRRYNRWIDKGNAGKSWDGGCTNYFRSPAGRIVTQWPYPLTLYAVLTRVLGSALVCEGTRRASAALEPAPSSPRT
ncbi:MAG: flavin-containing monooxygenase [Alphaproteobacteria bacterium]